MNTLKTDRWSIEEIEYLKENYGKILTKNIALALNRRKQSVQSKASYIGLKGNPSATRRKHSVDLSYFQTPDQENSYWAGFLAADGCVTANSKHRVRLKLASKDVEHLNKFKSCCNYGGKLHIYKQNNKKYYSLEICAKEWTKDLLENYKITPKKTFTLQPPKLNKINSLCYIIGYIDGDGCIFHDAKPKRGNPRLSISLIGTEALLTWIKKIFDKLCPKFCGANVRKSKSMWTYCVAGYKAKKILDKLNKLNTPKLQRKWDKCTLI